MARPLACGATQARARCAYEGPSLCRAAARAAAGGAAAGTATAAAAMATAAERGLLGQAVL